MPWVAKWFVSSSATCSTTGVTGEWDNAYDIWLDADPNADHSDNSAGDHLELMIWLDDTLAPAASDPGAPGARP